MRYRAKTMQKLYDRVASDMGDGLSCNRLFAQKTAFAAAIAKRERVFSRNRLAFFAAAAAVSIAVLIGGGVWFAHTHRDGFAFHIAAGGPEGTVGRWLHTRQNERSSFTFEQGSRFVLEASTDARVANADEKKVKVELLRGRLEAHVVGNGRTRWEVMAGSYLVSVVGTRFYVNFEDATGSLEVEVTEGRVRVEGPGTEEGGVFLIKGNRLRLDGKRRPVFDPAPDQSEGMDAPSPDDDKAQSLPKDAPQTTRNRRLEADVPTPPLKDVSEAPPRKLKWLTYYEREEYTTSIEEAARFGIDALVRELDAENLWKLQVAARMAQKPDTAFLVLTEYRRRFPSSKKAATAGFLLGKIALDIRGLPNLAASWFKTYLNEDPAGPLAEEALGRLIMVYEKMGRTKEAREAARHYLDRYENGAFDQTAERVKNATK